MDDLIAINKKYEKIFKTLDMILIFIVFVLIVLTNIHILYINNYIYLADFYGDLSLKIYFAFIAIYAFIYIFSIYFGVKGKTKQVKNFAWATLNKCIISSGLIMVISLVIMLIFNLFNWIYGIYLLVIPIPFIFWRVLYAFDGMFNLKLRKAKKLRLNENIEEALILFHELEHENYEYPSMYYELGLIYEDKEEYDKALEYFNKLINLEDNLKFERDKNLCSSSYEHKAYILSKIGKYDGALEAIDYSIMLKGNNYVSWSLKGYILYLSKKPEESLDFFDKAIELNPINRDTYYFKALALIDLERYDDANSEADSLLEIEPNGTMAISLLGKLGKIDEALAICDKLLQKDSNNVDALREKAYILDEVKRFEESLKYYDKVLKLEPENADILNSKGFVLCEIGKNEKGLNYINKSLELEPDNTNTLHSKGFALENLGEYKKALKYYERVLELNPRDEDGLKGRESVLKKIIKK